MRRRRSSSASSSACSLKIEERSDGGVKGPDALDKLLIGHFIIRVDVHVQVTRQDRRNDLEILVGLFDANLDDCSLPVLVEILVQSVKERLA